MSNNRGVMVGEIIGKVKGQISNNRDVMVGEIIGTVKGQRSYHRDVMVGDIIGKVKGYIIVGFMTGEIITVRSYAKGHLGAFQ